jgi:uncharacterized protein YeaO (DUF488 family)
MIKLKRIYEQQAPSDGYRVLVDRLWPRGVSKEKAALDLWLKDIAPSDALRKWFAHDPEKWPEFKKKYLKELRSNQDAVAQLAALIRKGTVTLLYAAKDEAHNEALIIADFMKK